MAIYMKVNGKMIRNMAKEILNMLKVTFIKDYGKMIKNKEMAHLLGQMAIFIKLNNSILIK